VRRLLLGVLVVAGLAGCGGSDPKEASPAPRSTEARLASEKFVRRLDALCKEAPPPLAEIRTALMKARDAARAGRVSAPTTFQTFVRLLRRASATTEAFKARLRAVEVPAGERAFHVALVGSLERGAANLRRQVSAARAQDAVRLRDLSVNGSLINARQKGLITGHGGFRVCGRG